jgi:hypothetical protein
MEVRRLAGVPGEGRSVANSQCDNDANDWLNVSQ